MIMTLVFRVSEGTGAITTCLEVLCLFWRSKIIIKVVKTNQVFDHRHGDCHPVLKSLCAQGCRTDSSLSGGKSHILELGTPDEEEVGKYIHIILKIKVSLPFL